MINKAFIEETDSIIKRLKERQIDFIHGNVLIAKVKVDRITSGGIIISDNFAEKEEFKSGFARIIALESGYEGPLSVGDYVMFAHEARYPLHLPAIREILGLDVTANLLFTMQDNSAILKVKAEVLEK